jgi:hypothetical protein
MVFMRFFANMTGVVAVVTAMSAATLVATPAAAQPATRFATTVDALSRFPLFFHGKQVVARGTITRPAQDVVTIRAAEGDRPVFLLQRGGPVAEEGSVEVRGEFWDLGRLSEDDPRLAMIDVQRLLDRISEGRWPPHGQVPIIVAQQAAPAERLETGLRALALEPSRYEGQKLTVIGRFRGANLYGDLPQSPGVSRSDFVLQSADASVWVTGARPRGRGFNLDPSRRLDTGKPLQVSGTVRYENGLVWIEATRIELGPDSVPAAVVEVPAPVQGPPPAVAFSIPVSEETDVSPHTTVRIQFTRDMAPDSFKGRISVSYLDESGTGQVPAPSATYRRENRVLEISFSVPLERFRTVKLDLRDGITATDGAALAPWSLIFSVGAGG